MGPIAMGALLALAVAAGWPPSAAEGAKRVTIRFSEYPRPNESEMFAVLKAEFEKQNPDIEVVYEPITDPVKMTTAMVAGTAPDIVCWWSEDFRRWAEQGFLLDLKPYIDRFMGKDLADFNPAQIQAFNYKGMQYALPQYLGTVVTWYNRDLFDEQGLAPFPNEYSWEQMLNAARKLTVRQGDQTVQWGLDLYNAYDRIVYWVRQNGGKVQGKDETVVALDDPKAIEAMQFVQDLIHRHRVVVPSSGGLRLSFPSGKAAMIHEGSWSLAFMLPDIKFRLGFAHMPQKAAASTLANLDGYAIYRNTPHPEAAWKFLQFVTSAYANRVRAQYQGLQPARRSVALDWVRRVQSVYPAARDANVEVFGQAFSYAEPVVLFADQGIVNVELGRAFARIFTDGESPAQVMRQVVPSINAQLKAVAARSAR